MAGEAQGGEEGCEGVEEGGAGTLLTDHHTGAQGGEVHTTTLQDVRVATQLLATGVQHRVRHVGVSSCAGRGRG